VAAGYSTTWSARPSADGGIVRRRAFAVVALMSSESGRLLDREIAGFGSSQDLVHEVRGAPP
jgi:hypothetical protein